MRVQLQILLRNRSIFITGQLSQVREDCEGYEQREVCLRLGRHLCLKTRGGDTGVGRSTAGMGFCARLRLISDPATLTAVVKAMESGITSTDFIDVLSRLLRTESPSQLTPSTGLSPASSYQYLSAPEPSKRDDDASSTCSTDSRRPSVNAAAADYINDQSGMNRTIILSCQ